MSRARERLVFSATAPYQPPGSSWWQRVEGVAAPWQPALAGLADAAVDLDAPPLRVLPPWLGCRAGSTSRPRRPIAAPVAPRPPPGDDHATRLGKAVHRVLEWAGAAPPTGRLRCLAEAAAREFDVAAAEVETHRRRDLEQPRLRAILPRTALSLGRQRGRRGRWRGCPEDRPPRRPRGRRRTDLVGARLQAASCPASRIPHTGPSCAATRAPCDASSRAPRCAVRSSAVRAALPRSTVDRGRGRRRARTKRGIEHVRSRLICETAWPSAGVQSARPLIPAMLAHAHADMTPGPTRAFGRFGLKALSARASRRWSGSPTTPAAGPR